MTLRKRALLIILVPLPVVALLALLGVARYLDVSPRFLVKTLLERHATGIGNTQLAATLRPEKRYANRPLQGVFVAERPRILLPAMRGWEGKGPSTVLSQRRRLLQERGEYARSYDPCGLEALMPTVMCWLLDGNPVSFWDARTLLTLLPDDDKVPREDAWHLALAFDFLSSAPFFDDEARHAGLRALRRQLELHLDELDEESQSLWHRRFRLAVNAWSLAVAIAGEPGVTKFELRRAQGHFDQAIQALELTEAWPGGYNYWINSRAMPFAISMAATVNGLEGIDRQRYLQLADRAARWPIHGMRPDHKVGILGDEGPRRDLKDETQRYIDLVAQLTREPLFATFSAFIGKLHGRASYYRGYHWSVLLFHDPSVPLVPGIPSGDLAGLERYLPVAERFGPGAMNLAYIRQGWGPQDTFLSYRAGHSFSHHGAYDAGHFTIFKGGPLAITNASYRSISDPHRIYYGVRTVSRNSILVLRPGEVIQPNKLFKENVVDGGQRLTMPTGASIRSVDHWKKNLGRGHHYEGGQVDVFQHESGRFSYISSDLSKAYDNVTFDSQKRGGKVTQVKRELLYLSSEDRLIVFDRVKSTKQEYTKKWLMHTFNKPEIESANPIVGRSTSGILQSSSPSFHVGNGSGTLSVDTILPEDVVVRLIGGPGFEYYVESDGVDGDIYSGGFDGINFKEGVLDKPWFDNGGWRVELQSAAKDQYTEFLVGLSPGLDRDRSGEVTALEGLARERVGLATPNAVVVFVQSVNALDNPFDWPAGREQLMLVGVEAGDRFEVIGEGKRQLVVVNEAGAVGVDVVFAGRVFITRKS